MKLNLNSFKGLLLTAVIFLSTQCFAEEAKEHSHEHHKDHSQKLTQSKTSHVEKHGDHISQSQSLDLSLATLTLLREEMRSIKDGMASLVFDTATGNWKAIQETAENIHNSYVLKQKLTKHQLHELHNALPMEFQSLDSYFHQLAKKLAQSAEQKDMDLVHYYQFKMNETCTACHSQFAKDRFTGLGEKSASRKKEKDDHHSH